MSAETDRFFEQLKDGQKVTLGDVAGGVKEFTRELYPGLSLGKILSDIGTEVTHQVEMGAHELASALFTGHGFVLYPRGGHDDGPDVSAPEVSAPEVAPPTPAAERGGMER